MPEDVKTVAEPSAAAAGPIQYDSWDEKGNPVVSKPAPKPEEAATSAAPAKPAKSEPEGKSAAEPEPAEPEPQEPTRKPGEKLSLKEEVGKLRRELREARDKAEKLERERSREPEPKPASTEAKAEPKPPQTYTEWRKQFKPTTWMEEYAKANPSANYDDAMAACTDFQSDMRDRYRQYEQAQAEALEKTKGALQKTIDRYPDAKEKITSTMAAIQEAPPIVHSFLNDSEVTPELLYALSDPETLANLVATAKTSPGKVLRVLRDMELDIEKELKAPETTEPTVAKKVPVETKPRAPEPPAVVGGRGAAAEDAAVAAARSGDFRAFEAEENRRRFAVSK